MFVSQEEMSMFVSEKKRGHYQNDYNLEWMQILLENNGFIKVEWEYFSFPRWLESWIISFPFKFPLSLLFTHFRKNRLKFETIAKKVTFNPAFIGIDNCFG